MVGESHHTSYGWAVGKCQDADMEDTISTMGEKLIEICTADCVNGVNALFESQIVYIVDTELR